MIFLGGVAAAPSQPPTAPANSGCADFWRRWQATEPNLAARLLKSAMATNLMRASPAKAKSDGNLHYPSTDAAHIEGGQVAPSSIGSARFGTCCSVRNSACCEGRIIARPRPGGCRPDAGVRYNRRLDLSRCARRFSRCTSCALRERSPRAFLHEPPVKSAVPELPRKKTCRSRKAGFPLKIAVLPVRVGSRRRRFAWIGNPVLINAFCLSWLLQRGAWKVLPHELKISSLMSFVSAFRHRSKAAGRGKTGLFRN